MTVPNGDWKKFNPDTTCTCEDENLGRLSDEMTGEEFWICMTCNKEVLPCEYCGQTPCKCVENNNEVDEARGN